jgi:hypothetical protein
MTTPITLAAEGYDELAIILRDAFEQASRGKGAERHANDLPFDQQPMQSISSLFDSDKGMAFQVVKKLREGLDMPEFDRLERELLGSIVYTAGIILWHKRRRVSAPADFGHQNVIGPKTYRETMDECEREMQALVSSALVTIGATGDGWIEWRPSVDDRAPRPSGVVDYITRSGNAYAADSALLDWTHRGSDFDVIKYRPAK